MDQIYRVSIPNPPTKYTKKNFKIKLDDKGAVKPTTDYYLTANLLFDNTHWATRNWILGQAKQFLMDNIKDLPKLEKMRVRLIYHHPTDLWDLDNKGFFWTKCLLDILKTPTSEQILKAEKYDNPIKSLEIIYDDCVRYVDEINWKYERGPSALEIIIFGRLANTQQNLF